MQRVLLSLIVAGLFLPLTAQKALTLEDIFIANKFRPEYVWGINHLPDGAHYSALDYEASSQSLNILVYDYETGEVQDTLFHGAWVKEQYDRGPFMFYEYSISPDETKILLAANTESIYRYSTKADYYVFDRATKKLHQVTTGPKQMYATFSPDSRKVAYVQSNNLFYKDLESGDITQITEDGEWNKIINGAADWVYEEELVLTKAFEWSPDSKKIAFFRFDEARVKMFSMDMYGGQYPEQYTFKYPKVGEKNALVSLHCYFLKKDKVEPMGMETGDDHYFPRMQWTKDADILCVQKLNRHQNELELILLNVKKGKQTTLMKETNPYYIDITDDLTFLKNGKEFIWTSEQSGYNHIYLFNMDGEMEEQLTQGEWDVTHFLGVDEDKKLVYYESAEVSPLERHIYSVKLNGKGKKQLTDGDGQHSVDFSADFSYSVRNHSTANQPMVYSVYDKKNNLVRTIEDNGDLEKDMAEYGFVDKEFFQFETVEGTTLNGWMMKPADFDPSKEYPVLMYVYGGPGSQTVQNGWGGRSELWFQYLTQQGYIIASVDNRGTGARGQEFKKQTYLKLGVLEVEDQIAAARYLGNQAYVDRDRVGIFGWSYGGYMSSLCLFQGADVFSLAIAVAPVTHWKYYDTIYTERFMRTLEENEDGYEKGSPINYVDGLEGDFLLIHGSADDNVHFQNTVDLTAALVNAGKQFDLFFYPNKNHGLPGPETRFHLYTKMTNYLKENL